MLEPKALKARIRRLEPGSNRSRLLDGAEGLFASRGYYGVSVRDIAQEAGAPLGLATYYFPTKEELFRQVILRRADELVEETLAAMLALENFGTLSIEALLRAYLTPLFRRSIDGGPGWKNYVQLLCRSLNLHRDETFLLPVLEVFHRERAEFLRLAQLCLPGSPQTAIFWSDYFLNAAVLHLMLESGMVDAYSGGACRTSDLPTVLDEAITYFSAGFKALARQ